MARRPKTNNTLSLAKRGRVSKILTLSLNEEPLFTGASLGTPAAVPLRFIGLGNTLVSKYDWKPL